jgi:hypothetical protein
LKTLSSLRPPLAPLETESAVAQEKILRLFKLIEMEKVEEISKMIKKDKHLVLARAKSGLTPLLKVLKLLLRQQLPQYKRTQQLVITNDGLGGIGWQCTCYEVVDAKPCKLQRPRYGVSVANAGKQAQ